MARKAKVETVVRKDGESVRIANTAHQKRVMRRRRSKATREANKAKHGVRSFPKLPKAVDFYVRMLCTGDRTGKLRRGKYKELCRKVAEWLPVLTREAEWEEAQAKAEAEMRNWLKMAQFSGDNSEFWKIDMAQMRYESTPTMQVVDKKTGKTSTLLGRRQGRGGRDKRTDVCVEMDGDGKVIARHKVRTTDAGQFMRVRGNKRRG